MIGCLQETVAAAAAVALLLLLLPLLLLLQCMQQAQLCKAQHPATQNLH
jgi:hypothetical protein